MKVFQSSSFGKKIKKFKKKEKLELDKAIQEIINNPSIVSEKKGDLRGIFVRKFIILKSNFLSSYRLVGNDIELIAIGQHENYFRDLKSYLKKR